MRHLVKLAALTAVVLLISTDDASAFGRRNGCNGCWGGGSSCVGGGCWGGGWSGCHGGGCHGGYHAMHAGCHGGCHSYTGSYAGWAASGYGGLAYWSVPRIWYGAPYQSVSTAGVISLGDPIQVGATPNSDRATLVLNVPADAKLTINGAVTTSTSARRVFETPALEPGREYEYTVLAEVTRNGATKTATRTVVVRPGQETRETIEIPGIQVAGR